MGVSGTREWHLLMPSATKGDAYPLQIRKQGESGKRPATAEDIEHTVLIQMHLKADFPSWNEIMAMVGAVVGR